MTKLLILSAIPAVVMDAYLADDTGSLLFLSIWGCDTALQELLARLQLPHCEHGIRVFSLNQAKFKRLVNVPNVNELNKITTKTPSHTVFGLLTQLWIYAKLAIRPDPVNHRALIAYDPEDDTLDPLTLLKTVCPLPLLDSWKTVFLERCWRQGWIISLENGAGVAGRSIELDDTLEPMLTEMNHQSALTLPLTA